MEICSSFIFDAFAPIMPCFEASMADRRQTYTGARKSLFSSPMSFASYFIFLTAFLFPLSRFSSPGWPDRGWQARQHIVGSTCYTFLILNSSGFIKSKICLMINLNLRKFSVDNGGRGSQLQNIARIVVR